ncbi:MAG: M23 family metallopeptidase [Lachnospiraceae bacterium]|nr:M23 family metallopeptidase [Lachnospiraceae bacterium]
MKRIKGFFSTKGFYIALSVGVFAFAALMVAGDLRETREEMEKEQIVDLNEPADQIADSTDATKEAEDDTNKTEKTTETNSPSAVADVKEEDVDEAPVTEESIQEETVLTNSDGAEAEEAPDIVFDEERSLLWPVMGNVILPYSMDTTVYFQTLDVYKCNPAILIQAEEGTNVTAACNGIVKDITETREFGTMVVVDLGSGYEATYGQVMNVCVNVGDRVSESQNIAEIAPASSYYSEEGNHLYFAITKDGVPVDPMSLIQ